jgi:hypothetical protein
MIFSRSRDPAIPLNGRRGAARRDSDGEIALQMRSRFDENQFLHKNLGIDVLVLQLLSDRARRSYFQFLWDRPD